MPYFLMPFDYVVGGTAFRKVQMSVQADVFNALSKYMLRTIHISDRSISGPPARRISFSRNERAE